MADTSNGVSGASTSNWQDTAKGIISVVKDGVSVLNDGIQVIKTGMSDGEQPVLYYNSGSGNSSTSVLGNQNFLMIALLAIFGFLALSKK